MKQKLLLFAALSIGIGAQAQFTGANAPTIGDHTDFFGLDTLAPSFDGIVGTGVTWDYNATLGIPNETRSLNISSASSVDTAGDFPTSTHAQVLESLLTTFYTDNTTNGRISQGIIFQDPTIGSVVVQFDVDPENLYTYPFNMGSTLDDVFMGHYALDYLGNPITGTVDGKVHIEVDGEGTLKLANNVYSNVLRYKLLDTVNVVGIPLIGDITMIRVQYEYYDHASSTLPIFIYTKVILAQASNGAPISTKVSVLSIEEPSSFVGLTTNTLEGTSIYPNPTEGVLNIQLPSSVQSADIQISDALGRAILRTTMNSAMKTLDVSSLNNGIYFVNISDGSQTSTKRIVIK